MAASEKSMLESKLRVTTLSEQLAVCQRQSTKLSAEQDRLVHEIENGRNSEKRLLARLAILLEPFAVVLSESGAESVLLEGFEQRSREYRDREQSRASLVKQLGELKSAIEKCEDRLRTCREQVDDLFGAVRTENLEDVVPSDDGREIANVEATLMQLRADRAAGEATATERREAREKARAAVQTEETALMEALRKSDFSDIGALRSSILDDEEVVAIDASEKELVKRRAELSGQQKQIEDSLQELRSVMAPQGELLDSKEAESKALDERIETASTRAIECSKELERDDYERKMHDERSKQMGEERRQLAIWQRLRDLIGSHDGRKFRTFAQGLSLDVLLRARQSASHQAHGSLSAKTGRGRSTATGDRRPASGRHQPSNGKPVGRRKLPGQSRSRAWTLRSGRSERQNRFAVHR